MKPLLKWPGGKTKELDQIYGLIPEHKRYLEPFFGGGALYFRLQPQQAAINDTAKDLMEFYHMIRTGNPEFHKNLICYAESFRDLLDFGRSHATDLLKLFDIAVDDIAKAKVLTDDQLSLWMPDILGLFSYPIVSDRNALQQELSRSVWDKLCRTVKNHSRHPFSADDLTENLVTGLASGYYLYFRKIFNDWQLDRIRLSPGQRAANFYFIREHCYGSMFRYNRRGEFNIPYGGMSYNNKDFSEKVQMLLRPETAAQFAGTQIYCRDFEDFFQQVHLSKYDFMFLDPPYDTEFSDYEGSAFSKLDHARLAVALSKTPAKFLLIIKSTPFIEALYSSPIFYIRRFDKQYTYNVRSRNDRSAEHLIITNYSADLQ